jgi:hypothetical protein
VAEGTFTVVVSHRRKGAAIDSRADGIRVVRIVPSTTPQARCMASVRAMPGSASPIVTTPMPW